MAHSNGATESRTSPHYRGTSWFPDNSARDHGIGSAALDQTGYLNSNGADKQRAFDHRHRHMQRGATAAAARCQSVAAVILAEVRLEHVNSGALICNDSDGSNSPHHSTVGADTGCRQTPLPVPHARPSLDPRAPHGTRARPPTCGTYIHLQCASPQTQQHTQINTLNP